MFDRYHGIVVFPGTAVAPVRLDQEGVIAVREHIKSSVRNVVTAQQPHKLLCAVGYIASGDLGMLHRAAKHRVNRIECRLAEVARLPVLHQQHVVSHFKYRGTRLMNGGDDAVAVLIGQFAEYAAMCYRSTTNRKATLN